MNHDKQATPSGDTSRRTFLKETAAGAAAVGGLSLARSAHAAGTGEIKIGMIGCGGRCSGAAAYALALGKDVKLAALADVFEDRMDARRKLFQQRFPDQFIATDDTCVTNGLDGYKTVIEACRRRAHRLRVEVPHVLRRRGRQGG